MLPSILFLRRLWWSRRREKPEKKARRQTKPVANARARCVCIYYVSILFILQ